MIYEQLTEEECYLLALIQDESGIDLAEFALVDDTALRPVLSKEDGRPVLKENGRPETEEPDGCFRAFPYQYAWLRDPSQKKIDAAGRCIAGGQLVKTSSGWKPIEDVEVGDLVLTHKGRWRPVTAVWDRGVKDIVELLCSDGERLLATPDHKVWARYRGSIEPSWIPIEDMDESIVVAVHKPGTGWSAVELVTPMGSANTYDLSVDEDHSFVVEGVICHNSVGKSLSIKLRALAFPFNTKGEEMVITAPTLHHVTLVTDNVTSLFSNCRIAREMLEKKTKSVTQRPFKAQLQGGGRIIGVIPHHDGSGYKGTHPLILDMDEAQDLPDRAWKEVVETVKDANENSRWTIHGVTNSDGGEFDHKLKDPEWVKWRRPSTIRPNWTDAERKEKINEYGGSANSIDFRRNVLGLSGNADSVLFVSTRVNQVRDMDEDSVYNKEEYYFAEIDDALINETGDIIDHVEIPASHSNYERFWIGVDLGWTLAPTAVVVFGEVLDKKTHKVTLKLLTRLLLFRVPSYDQISLFLYLMKLYRPQGFAMDKTGQQGFWDILQNEVLKDPDLRFMADRLQGLGFSEKITVGFDSTVEFNESDPNAWRDAAINRNVIEASTDAIRELIDEQLIQFPYDSKLVNELLSSPAKNKSVIDSSGKKIRKLGQHSLDAIRMAVLSYAKQDIDQVIERYESAWSPPEIIVM